MCTWDLRVYLPCPRKIEVQYTTLRSWGIGSWDNLFNTWFHSYFTPFKTSYNFFFIGKNIVSKPWIKLRLLVSEWNILSLRYSIPPEDEDNVKDKEEHEKDYWETEEESAAVGGGAGGPAWLAGTAGGQQHWWTNSYKLPKYKRFLQANCNDFFNCHEKVWHNTAGTEHVECSW